MILVLTDQAGQGRTNKTKGEEKMNEKQVYAVYHKDKWEGEKGAIIGYATGEPKDITAFYKPQFGGQFCVEKIKIIDITPETISAQKRLKGQKKSLEARLRKVEAELEGEKK